jgi:hypothetical protein
VNVAKVGKAACKSRTALKTLTARQWRATAGATVKTSGFVSVLLKSASDVSVWIINPKGARCLSPVGGYVLTGCARNEHVATLSRNGWSSAQSGIKLTTYRTKGLSNEQGNFDSDARPAKPGKPPSPAMFRTEDGALVVVRARESRAHGEGEQ